MSKGLKVTIQTKAYLKKYLLTLYGEPLRFTSDNEFGMCLASFIYRPVSNSQQSGANKEAVPVLALKSQQGKEALRMRFDKYDTLLDIHLPKNFLTQRRGGFEIKEEHVIVLNRLFEKKFESDLWHKCNLMSILGIEIKEALVLITDSYNIVIDEDITMDSLVRKEYRFRKKMELVAPKLSAEFVKMEVKKIILHNVRNGKRHS